MNKMKNKKLINTVERAVPESEERLRQLDTQRNSQLQNLAKKAGFDFKSIQPKMENYKSALKWNEDSLAYMQARLEVLKSMAELANTMGAKVADTMLEIQRISYFIDDLEKKAVDNGHNPLDNPSYMKALKMKQDMLAEYNKLNLDYGRAVTDYKYKKAMKPEMDSDDLFTVKED
jgi:hypothetical protein